MLSSKIKNEYKWKLQTSSPGPNDCLCTQATFPECPIHGYSRSYKKIIGQKFVRCPGKVLPGGSVKHGLLHHVLSHEITVIEKAGWKGEPYYKVVNPDNGVMRVITYYKLKKYFLPI